MIAQKNHIEYLLSAPVTVFAAVMFTTLSTTLDAQSVAAEPEKEKKNCNIKFTARIHSMGMFLYSGRVANDNPATDINFTCDYKRMGFMFLKVNSLYDLHANNNLSLSLVYKNFKLGKAITITPNVGFILEQEHSIADRGSDGIAIITTSVKLGKGFTIDNSIIFNNLVVNHASLDWVNRLRVIYTQNHFDMTLMAWHNNKVFDDGDYVSSGLTVAYSRVKVSDHVQLSTGVTGLVMIETSDENSSPKKNGLTFTIAVSVN